jgi:hypothetical protein
MLGLQPLSSSSPLFTENFEGSFPSTNWNVGDDDANNGYDYWDDVAHRAYSGSWSGWCAAIGTKTDGTPNTNTWTYDNYMKAYLSRKTAFDARSWDIAFLTYQTWYNTESGYDHLDLSVTGDGTNWREIFQYKDNSLSDSNGDWELSGNSGGYQYRVARVPETTSAGAVYTSSFNIGFYFQSDSSVGPGQYEGAYLDDISLTTYDINFDYVSLSSSNVNPGNTIQLGYMIDNISPSTLKIWLGATLTGPSGNQINDPAHDVIVSVPGYSHQYWYRYFTIPTSAPPGVYDITYAIWSGWTSPLSSSRQWFTYTWNDCLNIQAFDFSVSASPSSRTVTRGSSTTYDVTVALSSGLTQLVSLSVSGLPSGASSSFSPASGYPSFTSTLTVSTAISTSAGTYTLTITGSGGGKTHQTTVQLLVQVGTITVFGRFFFHEEDSVTQRPVRYAKVQLCDSDLGGTVITVLAETETQSNGYYEFPAIINDDGLGEDGYDIFVKIYADSFCVVVTLDSLPNPAYWAQTTQYDNILDGSFNMGDLVLTGGNRGAWCIYDTLILGYQYATTLSYFHPKVTARWPSSKTYTEGGNPYVMHFVSGDEWDEDVILHEYGHSIQYNIYGEWIPNSSGDHTWNQHTNQNFAFSEGWANFFGVLACSKKGYGDSLFPKDSHYRDTIDQSIDQDLETDPHEPGDDVEGAIACLLWDIYDGSNDGRDTLSKGMSPIWDVLKNYITSSHHCYTIHEFWNGWMDRGQDSQQQMWGIYYDHGINKDTTAPSNPTSFTCTHAQNVWSSNPSVTISWSGATDDLSGVYGYSYHWVHTPALPDASVDLDTSFTTTLGDGDWYFCIRTRDNAGNWNTGYVQYGPIRIDTSNPTYSGQTPIGGTRYDNEVSAIRLQIVWTDAQSGIGAVRFRYKYDAYSWSSWLSPSGSSSNTYWYDISSSEWKNYVENVLYWESYATNGAGSTTYTSTFTGASILDDDVTGPTLQNPSSTGDILDNFGGSYRIQIDAADPSGISTVDFAYKYGSGSWSSWLPHSGVSGNTYYYDISFSEWITHVGETIYFKVVAFDDDNDRGTADRAYTNSQEYTAGTISDDDTTPPTLTNPTCALEPSNSYKIQITVADPSGIYQVLFRYKFDSGTWTGWNLPSESSGNTYWYLISESEWTGHTTLYWEVFAEDNDNDRANDHSSTTSPTYQYDLTAANQPPSVLDIYPDSSSKYQGDIIRIYCDSYDAETPEDALVCKIWIRPAGDAWVISEQIMMWDGNNHYYDWLIPASAKLGYYDVKCNVSDGQLSNERTDYNEFQVLEPFDFTISGSPASRTIISGQSTTYQIDITLISGAAQLVSLTCSGYPSSTTCTFSPQSGYPSFVSTLTVSTATSTPAGTYTLTVTGTDGGKSHSCTVQLVINAPFEFSVSASPPSRTVTAGASATYDVTATLVSGATQTVTLSCSGLPSGAAFTFVPSGGNPTFISTLTITTTASTPAGSYTITITGTGPDGSHSTTVQLIVEPISGPVFTDGFESGSFSAWTGTSFTSGETAAIVNTIVHHGIYCGMFTSNGNGGFERAYCYRTIASQTELYARGYFRVATSGIADNDDRFYFIVFKAGSNPVAFAGWRQIGGVVKWNLLIRDGTGWAGAYSAVIPSLNQWYCVELHWKKDAANGFAELWVDGVIVCSVTGKNTAYYGDVNRVDFGLAEIVNCAATTVYGDCCIIAKTYVGLEVILGPIFADGFESGSFGAWTSIGITSGETATVVNTIAHHFTYSALFTSNGNGGFERAYCYKAVSSSTELYTRGYFYVSASGIADNDDRFYLIIFRAGSNPVAFAGWRQIGGIVRWNLLIRDGTGWAGAYSTTSPSLNQWYCIELHWKKDGTNGIGELWINGLLVCSITGKNTAYYGDINLVDFGLTEIVNCGATTVYGDCCVISNTYIGPEPSATIFADGFESGSFSAWTSTSVTSGETATVVNTIAYQGTYSAMFTSNGNGGFERTYCYKTISSLAELYARGYFRVATSGIADNDDRFYFLIFRAGSQPVAFAGWRQTGGTVKWNLLIRDGTGWAGAFSSASPSLNQWYCVELHWVESASGGYAELWVDGVLVCSVTGKNTAYYGDVNRVDFGLAEIVQCGATQVYVDCCVVANAHIGTTTTNSSLNLLLAEDCRRIKKLDQ